MSDNEVSNSAMLYHATREVQRVAEETEKITERIGHCERAYQKDMREIYTQLAALRQQWLFVAAFISGAVSYFVNFLTRGIK